MTTLIIVRHGNTFSADDIPLRVGAKTDLPLVESGRQQAKRVGVWLKQNAARPAAIYSAQLKRTLQTADLLAAELEESVPIIQDERFNEIDYGPDEGKPEAEVIRRIGADAIQAWDQNAIVPQGWQVDPQEIIRHWFAFADEMEKKYLAQTIAVVTSNGIARFAPYLTQQFETFKQEHSIKISTGALCILEKAGGDWQVEAWNLLPSLNLSINKP